MFLYIIVFSVYLNFLNLNKKTYTNLMVLLLFLISIFRSSNYGSDTNYYLNTYNSLSNIDFKNIFVVFKKDASFYYFSKIINKIGFSERSYMSILSLVFFGSLYNQIFKKSKYPSISIYAFLVLGFYYFSFTGLRQTLAISLILFSYNYLEKGNTLFFITFVILASLMHSSAIIFIISPFTKKIRISKKHILGLIVIFIALVVNKNIVFNLISLMKNTRFISYLNSQDQLNYSGFIIQLLIFLFNYYFYKYYSSGFNENTEQLIIFSFIGVIFQLFSTVVAEFFRISMYFSIFNLLLIPLTIHNISNNTIRKYVLIIIKILLIIYGLYSGTLKGFMFY